MSATTTDIHLAKPQIRKLITGISITHTHLNYSPSVCILLKPHLKCFPMWGEWELGELCDIALKFTKKRIQNSFPPTISTLHASLPV